MPCLIPRYFLDFRMCMTVDAYWVRCERRGSPSHCIEQEDEASSFIERSPRCDHINDLLIGLTFKWASQPSSVHNRFDNMHRLHGNQSRRTTILISFRFATDLS